MALSVTCQCGQSYQMGEEYAGLSVDCPRCGGQLAIAPPEGQAGLDPAFHRDKFLLRQKHMAISQKYYVWDEQGREIMFIQRPAHLLRNIGALLGGFMAGAVWAGLMMICAAVSQSIEILAALFGLSATVGGIVIGFWAAVVLSAKSHILFYRNDTKTEQLLEIKQDKKFFLINATYTLQDPAGQVLALFAKNYLYNVIRKRWMIYRPDGSLWVIAKEDSVIKSILRRLNDWFKLIFRTNFIILENESESSRLGEFNRKATLLDRYVLDMSADRQHKLDRRVALALGVLLDTGERR